MNCGFVAGAFGGMYLQDSEFSVSFGVQGVDRDESVFGGLGFGVYPSVTTRVGVSGSAGSDELYSGDISFRFQLPDAESNLSFRIGGGGGSISGSGFYDFGLGVRYQFGERKSLKGQLRENQL